MKNANNNRQQAQRMQSSGDQVFFHNIGNGSASEINPFAHPIIGYVKSSSRIGVGRVGSSYGVRLFSNFSKVTSVNSFMLVATGSNGAPAAKDTVIGFNSERILGVKTDYIRPINNDGGERVSNSQTTIGEENCGPVQETINQSGHEKYVRYGSTLTKVKRTTFYSDRSSHAGTKDVASTTIKVSSTGAKELRITTGFSQIFEGGSRHE